MTPPELTESNATVVLQEVVSELDTLAKRHYPKRKNGLADLLLDVDSPLGRKQYSRLLGVMVKAPYADEKLRAPSKSTQAVYGMTWKEREDFKAIGDKAWQAQFMLALYREEKQIGNEGDAYEALVHFKYESTLGKFIFQAFRNRICGKSNVSKELRAAIAAAKKSGIKLIEPTTANIQAGIASTVAVAVATCLPTSIAVVGAPVCAAIALLLLQVGVDGFCEWSKQIAEEMVGEEESERHG